MTKDISNEKPEPNLIEIALNIVADFEEFLENNPDSAFCISDETILSHPKNRIIDAFCLAMLVHQTTERREILLATAMSLARFQPNIGEPLHPLPIDKNLTSSNIHSMPNEDFLKMMTDSGPKRARYDALMPTVQKEICEIGDKMKIANRAYNRKFHPGMLESD
ncbi:MAG TPA: hypothetical protein VIJ78_12505 [Pseudolabrys sp.]|nr:hypothetical protein [Pseudolabrys sp.]